MTARTDDQFPDDSEFEGSSLSLSSRLPAFDAFARAGIYEHLNNIYGFDLVVEVPKMFQLVGQDWSYVISARIYEAVLTTLDSAEFFKSDSLVTVTSEQKAGVTFRDDEYQFEVYFDRAGDLHISRGGSTLKRFYRWYARYMPSVMSLVDVILNSVAEVISVTLYGREPTAARRRDFKLTPVAVSYYFNFLAFDFMRPQSKEIEKNVTVLRNLLRLVPGPDGDLQDPADVGEDAQLGRTDVNLCRFVKDIPDLWAQEYYRMSGPSDRQYTMIYMEFVYRGESFDTPDGARQRFRPELLLNNYEVPIVTFLKNRAIERYFHKIAGGFAEFQTSTGSLP